MNTLTTMSGAKNIVYPKSHASHVTYIPLYRSLLFTQLAVPFTHYSKQKSHDSHMMLIDHLLVSLLPALQTLREDSSSSCPPAGGSCQPAHGVQREESRRNSHSRTVKTIFPLNSVSLARQTATESYFWLQLTC